jgi:hypothetical protein
MAIGMAEIAAGGEASGAAMRPAMSSSFALVMKRNTSITSVYVIMTMLNWSTIYSSGVNHFEDTMSTTKGQQLRYGRDWFFL